MAERNWAGFRTVVDGLEGLWDNATKEWQAAQARQFQMEQRQAELRRQVAEPVVDAIRNAPRAAASMARQTRSSVGRVADAVVGNRPPSSLSEPGPINTAVVDRRVGETQGDISRNLEAAGMSGYPEAMAGAWPAAAGAWLARVWPDGEWDDKAQARKMKALDAARYANLDPMIFERQGNFSYGATAAALGLPKEVALAGAGAAQRGVNVAAALHGRPLSPSVGFFAPPYGDDPRDQTPISQGWDYGMQRVPKW